MVGVSVGVGVGDSDGVGLSDGPGLSDGHGSGVAVGNSGGTDASTTGPPGNGDGEGVGTAVAHGSGLAGVDGDAGLDPGAPCGTTTATPGGRWWRPGPVDAENDGDAELAGVNTESRSDAPTVCEMPSPPRTAAVTAAAPDIAIAPWRRARIRRPR